MTITMPPVTEPETEPRRRVLPLALGAVLLLVLGSGAVALFVGDREDTTRTGSGVPVSQARTVPAFTAIELAGANQVTVQVGRPRSVVVRGDDNLVDLVLTEVQGGTLVVSAKQGFSTRSSMSVIVNVPELEAATLSGAGRVTVTDVDAEAFTARMPGTGTLRVSGRADRVDATLSGTGDLQLGSLTGRDVVASLGGTGRVAVRATESLDASLAGTGTIVFTGDPATVTRNVSGTGAITEG